MTGKYIYNYEEQPIESKDGWILLVDYLNENCTENMLYKQFSVYGKISQIAMPFNRRTGDSRGYAFIKYYDKEKAIAARKDMDGAEICNHVVTVSFVCVKENELKKEEDGNKRVSGKKVRMRDITFGRKDLKNKKKNARKKK